MAATRSASGPSNLTVDETILSFVSHLFTVSIPAPCVRLLENEASSQIVTSHQGLVLNSSDELRSP